EPALVESSQQHHAGRWHAILGRGSHGHRVWLAAAARERLLQPAIELMKRVGGNILFSEAVLDVIFSQPGDLPVGFVEFTHRVLPVSLTRLRRPTRLTPTPTRP